MPAPAFQPTGPRATATPPVMYSQKWSPAPSTTAVAPRHEQPPAGGAVGDRVSSQHRVLARVIRMWPYGDDAAAHPFADVVLGFALERELNAVAQERAKALPRAAHVTALLAGVQRRANRAVGVVDAAIGWRGWNRVAVVLPLPASWQGLVGCAEHKGKVKSGVRRRFEQLRAAHHVIDRSCARARKVLAGILGDQEQIVDDVLRPALELRAKVLALGGDPGGTRVEVALPSHVATKRHQKSGAESELFSPEHGRDHDVAAVAQAAVRAQADPLAQPVGHQHPLRLGQAQLPRRARVLYRGQRRGAGAAVVAGDEDVVGAGFRDARGDRANACLRNQLDADSRVRVHRLQVVDELRQVFDRIDVVVRRRRDELHSRLRMAQARDASVRDAWAVELGANELGATELARA